MKQRNQNVGTDRPADRSPPEPRKEPGEPAAEGMLSIGALSRATGISVETLRAWETRHGYPVPERKPSGHRLYALESVARLRRIAAALSRGHRAGEVVGASDEQLDALLGATAPAELVPEAPPWNEYDVLDIVRRFDADSLTRRLRAEWLQLKPLEFLESRVAPLLETVGRAWARGDIEVRHEHFCSERVGDFLRSLRLPYEERAQGPRVVLATLPGESHGLGLQMVSLCLAEMGFQLVYLGTEVPVDQIATMSQEQPTRAVGISISLATPAAVSSVQVRALRELLPANVALVVGGQGAPTPPVGVETVDSLRSLARWAERLRH